ncbi:MAG: RHS repeat-associated core domain-containing protein [Verrucomicrobiales bacterium]
MSTLGVAVPQLALADGTVLTCPASTATEMHKLELNVPGTISVDATSRIDVSGKGYLAGRTTGNTTTGGVTIYGGASHGGLGGVGRSSGPLGTVNVAYGDYADPQDWGSGGGSNASGGGLVQLTAGALVLDGQILADGVTTEVSGVGGGASGGGVRLEVQTLSGAGLIRARGSNGTAWANQNGFGSGGGGAGGRVAVYAQDSSGFTLAKLTAPGGNGGDQFTNNGGPGTVYVSNGRLFTHVRLFKPAGRSGGYVGNEIAGIKNRTGHLKDPFTALDVDFNKAIKSATLPGNFFISGPSGPIAPLSFTEIDGREHQITIPAQTVNGAYNIVLLPSLLDSEEFELDQDADGIPGEPLDDLYTFKLILDTLTPRAVQHSPAGDVAGTISSVDIWFSETIDTTTLSAADISIRNPSNAAIAPGTITSIGGGRFRVNFPAQTATGQYQITIGPNIADLAGNLLNQDGDATPGETTEDVFYSGFNLVPVDLELSDVTVTPTPPVAGEPMTVLWKGRNTTGTPLIGDWIDGVYLSPDPFWNITDIRLGAVPHTGGLAANGEYAASLPVNVPGVIPGTYHLVIKADICNQTRETVENNNVTASGPVAISVRQVAVGESYSGTLTPDNRMQYFAINVPAGESLRLTLDGQSGVNHLFVNHASIPFPGNADLGGTAAAADQAITLTGVPGGGTYFVLVQAQQIGDPIPFQLSVETGFLFLTGITPAQHAKRSGERFYYSTQPLTTSVTLDGEGFTQSTEVEFVGTDGAPRSADRVTFVSPSRLLLHLKPDAWPAGTYDVRVTKGTTERTLPGAFTVIEEGAGKLEARLTAPALGPGGGQTLYVDYTNTGNASMPAPLLKVTAYTNAIITTNRLNRRPQDNLRRPAISGGGGGGGGGRTVNRIPSYAFRVGIPLHTVQVMAVGSAATPGILHPGERGRVPVYFAGLDRDRGEQQIQFSVGSVTADDTSIVNCGPPALGVPDEIHFPRHGRRLPGPTIDPIHHCPEYPFSPDWTALETSSKPEGVAADAWHAAWQNVTTDAGPLWVDYVIALGDNMNHLAKIGQSSNDPQALFNFEVLQATGAQHPVRTLAGAMDASAPSPGFPLVFRRTYGHPILSRYKFGPLGRGWTHNWDIRVLPRTTHQGMSIQGPGGSERFFGRYNDGSYTATEGDTGAVTQVLNRFRLKESDGTVWQFNADNRLDYVEDPNGNRITCEYAGDNLTSLTHSSGRQLLLAYNAAGRLTSLTDPLGAGTDDDRVTTYEYDGSGEHLIRVTAPGNRVTSYSYAMAGTLQQRHALTGIVHPDQTENSFGYDTNGRLVDTDGTCCGGAQKVTYAYDSAGTVTVTDATGRVTQLFYGLGGQLAQVRDGEGRIVNFSYDDASQLSQLLGPGGERYRYAYDGLGNLSGIEDPLRQNNSFTYEPTFNRLAQVRDARGNGLQYAYDTRGNLTSITDADTTSELFTYDARGNVLTSTNRRGQVITYAYNAAGQLTSKDYASTPGLTDFTYAYDPAGNLTNATYWNPQLSTQETLNLTYQPATDRLMLIEYPGGKLFTFDYDAAGRRTRRTDQDGVATVYVYDEIGRLARMTDGATALIVNYDYDPAGRLSKKTLGNGVFTTYTYNQAGQVTQLENARADKSVLSSFAYTYDASGRRASMTTLAGSETYGYDPLGQLTRVTFPNGRVVTYAYDAAGNRTQVSDNGVPTAYSANPLNQYTTVGGNPLQYDPDGNLIQSTLNSQPSTLTYDSENRLIGVATPTDTWTYTYDAFGNRIAATHNGQTTRYVIDPTGLGNVAAEYDGGGSLIARYEHGFGLLARTAAAGDPAFYTFSAIGHTSELTNQSGEKANSYSYDPFGFSLAKTETIPNPFEFVGELGVMNEGNGLEFMRARYYQANMGRFTSADPIGIVDSVNVYQYALNDPLMRSDPSGKWVQLLLYAGAFANVAAHYLANPYVQKVITAIPVTPSLPGKMKLLDFYFDQYQSWLEEEERRRRERLDDYDKQRGRYSLDELADQWERQRRRLEDEGFILPPEPNPFRPEHDTSPPIVRSSDPNDKLGPSGYGSAGYLPAGGVMTYQIRFENQPSATAPAQRVTVTDTLDPDLDLSTFEWTEIAFANQVIPVPAGLSQYTASLAFTVANQTLTPLGDASVFGTGPLPANALVVELIAALDSATRVMTFTLSALDPATGWAPEDPLTGLLYPNDDTRRGDGSISYFVTPKANLPSGTRIENRASIIFDVNDPIETPLVFNTLDADPPSSRIAALSDTTNSSSILLEWSGDDGVGGAGVSGYSIYVSRDGGPWILLLNNTRETSAIFSGEDGHTYAFYSVARDQVGHEEDPPAQADASTTLQIEPFRITYIEPETANTLRIEWGADPGTTYQIELSSDLQPPWLPVGDPIEADSTIESVIIDLGATPPAWQFIRIRRQPAN